MFGEFGYFLYFIGRITNVYILSLLIGVMGTCAVDPLLQQLQASKTKLLLLFETFSERIL